MTISKNDITDLLTNHLDLSGLEEIDALGESTDIDLSVFDEIDAGAILSLIDEDALYALIAGQISDQATAEGDYSVSDGTITFGFYYQDNVDGHYRIIPVKKSCQTNWDDFLRMLNEIIDEIANPRPVTGGTRFVLEHKAPDHAFAAFKADLERHRSELCIQLSKNVIFNPKFDWQRFVDVKKDRGEFGCPCQTEALCPCDSHIEDLKENGICYCGLFKIA